MKLFVECPFKDRRSSPFIGGFIFRHIDLNFALPGLLSQCSPGRETSQQAVRNEYDDRAQEQRGCKPMLNSPHLADDQLGAAAEYIAECRHHQRPSDAPSR